VYGPWSTYATVRESARRWLTKLRCEPDVADDMSASVADSITRQMQKNPKLRAAEPNRLDRYACVAAQRRLRRERVREDAQDALNERFRVSSALECSDAERPDVMFERNWLADVIVGAARTLPKRQQGYFICEYQLGMSREEIAERYGVTRASVDETMRRAYAGMRKAFTAQGLTFDLDVRKSRKEDA
jgi:RNA polymerase sigma factor (sigma-70 family)